MLTETRLSVSRCEPKLTAGKSIRRVPPCSSGTDTTIGLTGAVKETSPARSGAKRIDCAPEALKSDACGALALKLLEKLRGAVRFGLSAIAINGCVSIPVFWSAAVAGALVRIPSPGIVAEADLKGSLADR